MKKPTLLIMGLALISLILVANYKLNNPVTETGLASPNLIQILFTKPSPTPSPTRLKTYKQSLKTKLSSELSNSVYKFDSTTDLRKELDSVNPQILDSDFN